MKILPMDNLTFGQLLSGVMLIGSLVAVALSFLLNRSNKKLYERLLQQRKLNGIATPEAL